MRTYGTVAFLLASTLTAAAQESIPSKLTLLDDELPALMAAEDSEQDKQVEDRFVSGGALKDELPVGPYRRSMWTLHRAGRGPPLPPRKSQIRPRQSVAR